MILPGLAGSLKRQSTQSAQEWASARTAKRVKAVTKVMRDLRPIMMMNNEVFGGGK
jgi:hypothetical protein